MGRNLAYGLAALGALDAYSGYFAITNFKFPLNGFGVFCFVTSALCAVGAVDNLLEEHFKYTEKKLEKL